MRRGHFAHNYSLSYVVFPPTCNRDAHNPRRDAFSVLRKRASAPSVRPCTGRGSSRGRAGALFAFGASCVPCAFSPSARTYPVLSRLLCVHALCTLLVSCRLPCVLCTLSPVRSTHSHRVLSPSVRPVHSLPRMLHALSSRPVIFLTSYPHSELLHL